MVWSISDISNFFPLSHLSVLYAIDTFVSNQIVRFLSEYCQYLVEKLFVPCGILLLSLLILISVLVTFPLLYPFGL